MDSSQKADSTGRESSESTLKSPDKKQRRFSFTKKMVVCRITLLDGNTFEPKDIDKSATGRTVFDKICRHLDLVETDYFGLTYRESSGKKFWIDHNKKISKQVKGGTWVFEFNVKFYPPDPQGGLKEDITRYQLCLQLRVDIFNGRLPCSFVTYALLGSYTVQSELSDYDPAEHGKTIEYLKDFDFAPNQTPELLEKIMELHKQHKGQTPAEADSMFLDNSKKLAMYGVDLHEAKDSDRTDIMLGVCSSGILVYKDKLRINRFVWPKILNLSYKRSNFYVKIRPGEFEPHEKTIGFKLESHKLAKRLWKTCVEHHTFFRLKEGDKQRSSTLFPRFNSKFRYSGRTQAQAKKAAEMLDREEPHIPRTAERRSLSYPDHKTRSMDELAHRKNQLENDGNYPDENDRWDKKGVPTAITGMGPPPERDSKYLYEDGKYQTAPGPGEDDSEDRRDRLAGEGGDDQATELAGAGQPGSTELENKNKPGMKWALPGMKELMEKQAAQQAEKKRRGSSSSRSSSEDEGKSKDKSPTEGADIHVTVMPGFGDEGKTEKRESSHSGSSSEEKEDKSKVEVVPVEGADVHVAVESDTAVIVASETGDEERKERSRSSSKEQEARSEEEIKVKVAVESDTAIIVASETRTEEEKESSLPPPPVEEVETSPPPMEEKESSLPPPPMEEVEKKEESKEEEKRDGDTDIHVAVETDTAVVVASEIADEDRQKRESSVSSSSSEEKEKEVEDKSEVEGTIQAAVVCEMVTQVAVTSEDKKEEAKEKSPRQSRSPSREKEGVIIDSATPADSTETNILVTPTIKDKIEQEDSAVVESSSEEKQPEEEKDKPSVEGADVLVAVSAETDVSVAAVNETKEEDKKRRDSVSSASSSSSVSSCDYGEDRSGEKLPVDEKMAAVTVSAEVETTKKSTSSESEETMPFFSPADQDTTEKQKKIPPPVAPKGFRKGYDSEEDRHLTTDSPPTVPTESYKFNPDTEDTPVSTKNFPIVKTEKRTVTYEKDGVPVETEDSILISSSSHSTRSQTIETTTYKTEKDGVVETRVERKVTVTSDESDDIDHDDLLAKAILEVTQMNKDMSVEKIDICRQIEEDGSTTV